MEKVPQEIYDSMVQCLHHRIKKSGDQAEHIEKDINLPLLATLSQKWRGAIERRCFQNLKLKSNELDEFESIMTCSRRRYLRAVNYCIILPEYPTSSRQLFERHEDHQVNDEIFSAAIHRLFQIFKSWEDQSDERPAYSVRLTIRVLYSPTDYRFRSRSYTPTEEELQTQFGEFGMRYRYSYIHLLKPEELPIVKGIEGFDLHWHNWHRRKLAPQTLFEIAAKLPNLSDMRGDLADTESRYPALRQRYRQGLVQAIEKLSLPPSIKRLSLELKRFGPLDQTWQPTNVSKLNAGRDPLSTAVWRSTCHLARLTCFRFTGVADRSLLCPDTDGTAAILDLKSFIPKKPYWQHLKILSINFNMTTPSGQWYFRASHNGTRIGLNPSETRAAESELAMPPGYGSSEQDDINNSLEYRYIDELDYSGNDIARAFRLVPDEPVLIPLIEAFARACLQIPHLEVATLETWLREPIDFEGETNTYASLWGIYYAAPGSHSGWRPVPTEEGYPNEDPKRPRLTFNTRNWRPDMELLHLLRMIGGHEDNLELSYIDLWEMVEKPEEIEREARRKIAQAII